MDPVSCAQCDNLKTEEEEEAATVEAAAALLAVSTAAKQDLRAQEAHEAAQKVEKSRAEYETCNKPKSAASGRVGLGSGAKRVHQGLECETQGGVGVGWRARRAAAAGTLGAAIESSPKRQRV